MSASARYYQDVLESPENVDLEEVLKLDEAIQSLPPDLREAFDVNLDEAIQSLPLELREIIYKKFVEIKQRERAAFGWNKVHEALLKKPFSELLEQIVPVRSCMRCGHGSFVGSRLLCLYCELQAMNRHYTDSWRGRLNKLASRIFQLCIFGRRAAMSFLVNRGYSSLILTVLALLQHDMRQCR